MFNSKLKKENKDLIRENARLIELKEKLITANDHFAEVVESYKRKYPLEIGQVVYDVQLRSSKGRFTKTKPSREHSIINEVVVDKKNYFNLVDRYLNLDVFTDLKQAESYLDDVCVE